MHGERLLVVSARREMQRRIGGAMVAGGFEVAARGSIEPLHMPTGQRFDCTMLDASDLEEADFRAIAFCIKCHPVVLLADRPAPWLKDWVTATLDPEANDDELLAGVKRAIAAAG